MYTPHVVDTDARGPLVRGRRLAEGQSGRCERLRSLIRLDLRRRGAGGLLHLRDEPVAPVGPQGPAPLVLALPLAMWSGAGVFRTRLVSAEEEASF